MPNSFTTDVLISGAGPAGLTLAIELARRGVSFRLIEKMEKPFAGSRGKGIQPRTQEIFEDLGILDKIVAAGGTYPPLHAHHDDGSYTEKTVDEQYDPTPAEPYHIALMIPQFLTERIMRDRLAEMGHRVRFGCELIGFEQDEAGVTARLSGSHGEETIRARYLIGADGGHSFVRGALGVDFPGKTLGMRAIVADVTLTGLDRDAWHGFGDDDMERMVAICPLAGTALFQIQAPIPLDGEVDLSVQGLQQMIEERTRRHDIRLHSVTWASAYGMSARLADRYRVGRVFLAGDAAHIHPPTGGQGLNTSMQDAYNLGWKLAAVLDGANEALLDSYEEERRPVAESVLGLSAGLLDTRKKGAMHRGREVRQLDIGYPESSLSRTFSARSEGLRAGDRAPDAPIMGAAGQPSRLFQLFKGPHWTLLVQDAARQGVSARSGLHVHHIGPQGDVIDVWGHVRDAYSLAPGEAVLIRPDGYVGAILSPDADRAESIEEYLGHMGLVQLEERESE